MAAPYEEIPKAADKPSYKTSSRFLTKMRAMVFISALGILGGGINSGCSKIDDWFSDIEQAKEIKPLWQKIWKGIMYFKELQSVVEEFKRMDSDTRKEKLLKQAEYIADKIEEAGKEADRIIDAASEIRAKGVRINPGVVEHALAIIRKTLAQFDTDVYIKARRKADRWDWLSKKAERAMAAFYAAEEGQTKLVRLQKTLYSLIDREIAGYTNNSVIDTLIEEYVEKHPEAPIELEKPVPISVGLKVGDKGAASRTLQWKLAQLGYMQARSDDGDFGSVTRNALGRFQEEMVLVEEPEVENPVKGIVDERTLQILKEIQEGVAEDCKAIRPGLEIGLRGNDVKALQERLIELGFLKKGDDDSWYGGKTYNGVAKFQRECGWKGFAIPSRLGRVDGFTCVGLNDQNPYGPEDLCDQ